MKINALEFEHNSTICFKNNSLKSLYLFLPYHSHKNYNGSASEVPFL
jgi:hypothetical protein